MKRLILICLTVSLISFSTVGLSAAETSLRCGNQLIEIGDTMHQVRSACGEPVSEQRIGERTIYQILADQQLKIKDSLYLFEWIYKKDSGVYILTFEGGRLLNKEYSK